ncbi:MAG: hypothetical protein WA154_08165, partial [Moraxellaceae bacterium]
MNAQLGFCVCLLSLLAGCQPASEPLREVESASAPASTAIQTADAVPVSTVAPAAIIPAKPDPAAHPINPEVVAWQGRWQGVE